MMAPKFLAHGVDVYISPLMEVVLYPLAPGLDLEGIFVSSGHGIAALPTSYRDTPLWVVGLSTYAKAIKKGFSRVVMAGRTLEEAMKNIPTNQHLIHGAGAVSKSPLIPMEKKIIYEARAIPKFSKEVRAVLQGPGVDFVPLFSARSAQLFVDVCRREEISLKDTVLLAYSPFVATALEGVFSNNVVVLKNPTIKSFWEFARTNIFSIL